MTLGRGPSPAEAIPKGGWLSTTFPQLGHTCFNLEGRIGPCHCRHDSPFLVLGGSTLYGFWGQLREDSGGPLKGTYRRTDKRHSHHCSKPQGHTWYSFSPSFANHSKSPLLSARGSAGLWGFLWGRSGLSSLRGSVPFPRLWLPHLWWMHVDEYHAVVREH